jgi:hypothetical protein
MVTTCRADMRFLSSPMNHVWRTPEIRQADARGIPKGDRGTECYWAMRSFVLLDLIAS